MSINTIFNETELAIFHRQTNFTFGDFCRSEDGRIFALDSLSGQIFIGDDLRRSNVHAVDTVASVSMDEDNLTLKFKDSSEVVMKVEGSGAEDFVSGLSSFIGSGEDGMASDEDECLTDEELNETLSRLLNVGRDKAVDYLVEEVGMSMAKACGYVDGLDAGGDIPISASEPEIKRDGTMSRTAVFAVLKELKPGDRIHIEYKPFIGKLRIYDTTFLKFSVDTWPERYFTLNTSADDFPSLMENIASELFGYIKISFFCEDNYSDISCKLERITFLSKLSA